MATQTPPVRQAFCLFAERHDLPPNSGPIFLSYDWERKTGRVNLVTYYQALNLLIHGEDVWLYATGLTAALSELIGRLVPVWRPTRHGSLFVAHYDHQRQEYFYVPVLPAKPKSA
ncbi:hypothetical protein [Spirosoma sordidisoli]|uniref:Uncharacterized protein n=1 Tax=Spirosoma sordidisoli TaxID=2502893 RepID=A0A4Q2UHZ9_9BACT|nr:hypothetical protein [Spirosoma sordidisoli]RYC66369.1 hypothetical protein EQG79_30310 [Spirosoma sordidisoli]